MAHPPAVTPGVLCVARGTVSRMSHPTTDPHVSFDTLSATDLFRACFNQPTMKRRTQAQDELFSRMLRIARERRELAR